MAYQTLARKYRPTNFEELVGQESTTLVLKNAIKLGREPHGVIFSGVRGVGKTTVARLYAKALNCDQGPTEHPCNTCESCQAIAIGSHEDVLEIDGASNTGIDDIRALQDTLGYVPQRSKFKVYIIDEVHMLSTYAFNALLKSLEEPPPQVVFVFATTELLKIPETIVSRCLTFHLQKIPVKTIYLRLKEILEKENTPFEEKALSLIAREGHGSLRDALTLLDTSIALGEGKVEFARLEGLYSSFSSSPYLTLLEALIDRDPKQALKVISEQDETGRDLSQVIEETAKMSRHAFVIKDLGEKALDTSLLGLDDNEIRKLGELGKKAGPFDLNRIFRSLVQCRKDLDGSSLDRFVTENYMLEWCLDPGLPLLSNLMENDQSKPSHPTQEKKDSIYKKKITEIYNQIPELQEKPPLPEKQAPNLVKALLNDVPQEINEPSSLPLDAPPVKPAPFWPSTWEELVETWKKEKPLQARQLEEVHILEYSQDRIIGVVKEKSLAGKELLQKESLAKIREQFTRLFGFQGQLKISAQGMESPMTLSENISFDKTESLSSDSPYSLQQLPENILQKKQNLADEKRALIINEAKNNPLTKNILEVFEGVIEDIQVE